MSDVQADGGLTMGGSLLSGMKRAYPRMRDGAVCFSLAVLLLSSFIPLQLYAPSISALLYASAPIVGAAVVIFGFISRSIRLDLPGTIPLIVLQAVIVVSTIVYRQYSLVDNIKAIIWMTIPTFLFFCPAKGEWGAGRLRHLFRITMPFCLIFGVLCSVSVGEYVLQYGELATSVTGETSYRAGFIDGRLFGVFTDPNYAALAAILLIYVMVAALRARAFGRIISTAYLLSIVALAAYIVLSESRGAFACVIVTTVLGGFILGYRLIRTRLAWPGWASFLSSFVVGGLCGALAFGVIMGSRALWPQLPRALGTVHRVNGVEVEVLTNDAQWLAKQHGLDEDGDGTIDVDLSSGRPDAGGTGDFTNNRMPIWRDAMEVWKASPIVGATPRGYLDFAADRLGDLYIVKRRYLLHSAYISILVYGGILGAGAALWWLLTCGFEVMRTIVRQLKKPDASYFATTMLLLASFAACFYGLALTSLFYSNTFSDYLFWLITGTAVSLTRELSGRHFRTEVFA